MIIIIIITIKHGSESSGRRTNNKPRLEFARSDYGNPHETLKVGEVTVGLE
jgi:hypothetical protein